MRTHKKSLLMSENDKSYWKSKPDQHKTENERVDHRDVKRTQFFSDQSIKQNNITELGKTKTLSSLLKDRRDFNTKSNMTKFANFAKGVHGMELPRFSDTA